MTVRMPSRQIGTEPSLQPPNELSSASAARLRSVPVRQVLLFRETLEHSSPQSPHILHWDSSLVFSQQLDEATPHKLIRIDNHPLFRSDAIVDFIAFLFGQAAAQTAIHPACKCFSDFFCFGSLGTKIPFKDLKVA